KAPVLKGRFGMGIMIISFLTFLVALIFRSVLPADIVSPFVRGGYLLCVVGGIIAVARNEMLSFMVSDEEKKALKGDRNQMDHTIAGLDIAIIIVYVLLTLFIGCDVSKGIAGL